ncbi:hypothetical protein Poli38472_005555 [Pythium oligandrum]|uniref:Uncharacterized protein n=1 Tax=Pythium oligandrum TaxID=41045 RepID=A0A8K1CIS6_PYTOL|nr:hypothetical protein Poli38472_005555 [Pythium oligandrum]|eukprot:TMW62937.1 hypothetical protein Poli38472_005555 [Pythium oligandrum]
MANRRASFQIMMERGQAAGLAVDESQASSPQQPSPLITKKPKDEELEDDETDDNNQSENEGDDEGNDDAEDDQASEPEKKGIRSAHGGIRSSIEPPATTLRLRQENSMLKKQLAQMANQYEAKIRQLGDQLQKVAKSYDEIEHKMKKKIVMLEQQQAEANSTAKQYQKQIETLTQRLREIETASSEDTLPSEPPRMPLRRGNGSPFPYSPTAHGKHAFTTAVPKYAANQYRLTTIPSKRPLVAYPVPPLYQPEVHCQPSEPEHPHSCDPSLPGQKPAQNGFIGYCANLISSSITPSKASMAPSAPKMKVMPAWMYQQKCVHEQCSIFPIEDPVTLEDGAFKSIAIPNEVKVTESISAKEPGALQTATTKISTYLSAAALPIHGNPSF